MENSEELVGKVEAGDLDMNASFGFVCHGKLKDFIALRELIKSRVNTRLIFEKCSGEKLALFKKSQCERYGIPFPGEDEK